MSTQLSIENFEEIYNDTYTRTLRYIICKCSNIDDINDLLQDTYVELYKTLKRKKYVEVENYQNFIIGIAKKRIQKYYGILYELKDILFSSNLNDKEYELDIPSDFDIENNIITKLNAEAVWEYIKEKDIKIVKVFYLYYYSDLKISQIATELSMSESNVKNILYRTIKEISKNVKIEGDIDV